MNLRNIGYCPQYNPLFDKLTAREHLRLYAKLKTDKDQRNVEEEVNAIAQDTALSANLDSVHQYWTVASFTLLL